MSPTLESQKFNILSGDSSQDLERDSIESTRLSSCHHLAPHKDGCLMFVGTGWERDGREVWI